MAFGRSAMIDEASGYLGMGVAYRALGDPLPGLDRVGKGRRILQPGQPRLDVTHRRFRGRLAITHIEEALIRKVETRRTQTRASALAAIPSWTSLTLPWGSLHNDDSSSHSGREAIQGPGSSTKDRDTPQPCKLPWDASQRNPAR